MINGNPVSIQLKQGLATNLAAATLLQGELAYTTDTKKLFIGDGANINPVPNMFYGEIWYHQDTGPFYTQSITQNVAAIVACFDTADKGQLNNAFTYSSSALTCTVAGTYKVNYSISFGSSSSNHKHHWWIGINESGGSLTGEQKQTEQHGKPVNSSDVICNAGCGFLTLNVGDVVTLFMMDETGNETLTVYSANVNLLRIGN